MQTGTVSRGINYCEVFIYVYIEYTGRFIILARTAVMTYMSRSGT